MIKNLLTKKPFVRINPDSVAKPDSVVDPLTLTDVPTDYASFAIRTQADFLREYYPTGHRINSPKYYPNRIHKDPDTGAYYEQPVVRAAFAFQQIIALKHTITLCGNDIQFSLTKTDDRPEDKQHFFSFLSGWNTHDMEIAWYELVRSAKITGDGAVVGYMSDGNFRWKSLSYLDGDTLYPHYDETTGRMSKFLRKYVDMDEDGKKTCIWVEMWDETTYYRFRQQLHGAKGLVNKVAELFGLDGYELIESAPHGFTFCPVAYIRLDAPCWQYSQNSIEQYELAFSYLAQNNMAFAFPIMYGKGDNIEVSGDATSDSVKFISVDQDGEVGFLSPPDGSSFLDTELTKLYDMILEQSFVAKPPEVKSGDLPAAAIKLLYSPSIERAMEDASIYKRTLNALVKTFKYGYGIESMQLTKLLDLPISFYIEPYVHQNTSELISSLSTAVQAGFLSVETATERASVYATPQEYDRIIREKKEQDAQDRLNEIAAAQAALVEPQIDENNQTTE